MKVIAMYLPQFHRVPENDKWWGDGFTDWVSAREAKSLYSGHYQPHIPLDDNYYDLLNKDTMKWQADLMHRYEIDGMCMYHYWFEGGRTILERPAENLLKWKDIDMPFCFSWANETWARSWANIKNSNAWANARENGIQGEKILLNQNYGDINSWKEHFEYLCKFFEDDRYIKIDGKPVFLIYRTHLVECLREMLCCWRKWALERGFNGLYVIGSNLGGNEKQYLDAELYHEPLKSSRTLIENAFSASVKKVNYKDVWENIISEPEAENTFYGGFVGYDDTPRRGKEGVVIEGGTPDLFGKYLTELMAKNDAQGNDITFINAWNEWGEGMHLEPDKKFGYGFLEQVPISKKNFKNIHIKEQISNETYEIIRKRSEKFELYLNDMDMWFTIIENGGGIDRLLLDMGIHEIAVYGYGIMGRHLITQLADSEVRCKYIIDKQKDSIHSDLSVYSPEDELPYVDAIVVCSYYFISEIKLDNHFTVISLGDLIHRGYNGIVK